MKVAAHGAGACAPNAHDTIGCENAPAAAVKTALRRGDHERRIGDICWSAKHCVFSDCTWVDQGTV